MFYCESKNTRLNLAADIFCIGMMVYAMSCFNSVIRLSQNPYLPFVFVGGLRANIGTIIIGIILPAIALVETLVMVVTKKFRELPAWHKAMLLGNFFVLCVVAVPMLLYDIKRENFYVCCIGVTTIMFLCRICSVVFVTLQYCALLFGVGSSNKKQADIVKEAALMSVNIDSRRPGEINDLSTATNIVIAISSVIIGILVTSWTFPATLLNQGDSVKITAELIILCVVVLVKYCVIYSWKNKTDRR